MISKGIKSKGVRERKLKEKSPNSVWLQSECNRYAKVRGGRGTSSTPMHKSHKTKSESEEYDTLGSDSDTEVGTSSRTESSNHLVDSHHSAAADSRVHSMTVLIFSIKRKN